MFNGFVFDKIVNFRGCFVKECVVYRDLSNLWCMVLVMFDESNYSLELFDELDIFLPECILRSSIKRQAEFLSGRLAAAVAMNEFSENSQHVHNVGIGNYRQPLWPDGFSGSISHSSNRALAAASGSGDNSYLIGVDIEEIHPLEIIEEISSQVFDSFEEMVFSGSNLSRQQVFSLIFSAKETIFKSLFSCVNDYFGFEKARLISLDINNFRLTFCLDKAFAELYQVNAKQVVSFCMRDQYVVTYSFTPLSTFTPRWRSQ